MHGAAGVLMYVQKRNDNLNNQIFNIKSDENYVHLLYYRYTYWALNPEEKTQLGLTSYSE